MSGPERDTGSETPRGALPATYRNELLPFFLELESHERARKLERENADLRRLVFVLLFALLVTAGLAGWWFSIVWLGRR
jgi:hypothetical protein